MRLPVVLAVALALAGCNTNQTPNASAHAPSIYWSTASVDPIYWSPAGGDPTHYAQTTGFYAGFSAPRGGH